MRRVIARWDRLSLASQYMVASLLVLAVVMAGVGWWVAREIAKGVEHRTAETTALYVESFVAPLLPSVAEDGRLDAAQRAALGRLLTETPLGQGIVAFKIWDRQGRVIFSPDPGLIGQSFPMHARLTAAANGEVVSEISSLSDEENLPERDRWSRLLETYSPVRNVAGDIVAVVEFYEPVDELEDDISRIQQQTWIVVASATLATYLLLAGLVKRGSDTIRSQQQALSDTVSHLTRLLAQNEVLHERVRGAATRATALNEQYLRRISADLHDGPAQDVSVALLRFGAADPHDMSTIEACLRRALDELRAIAAGLRLPELEPLTLEQTVQRVVTVHARRTGVSVDLALDTTPEPATLPLKITVYRVVQEALANGYRHGGGVGQRVRVTSDAWSVYVCISDDGPGLGTTTDDANHLGLAVMRERVESLGGSFRLFPGPKGGVTVEAHLPRGAAPGRGAQPWDESG